MIKGNITLLWFVAGANLGWTLGGVLGYFIFGNPIHEGHAATLLVGIGLAWMAWQRDKNKSELE